MYKKIMVAVDGSETAQKALEEAQNIANSCKADLCIVYAIAGDSDTDKQTGIDILEQAKDSVDALSIETQLLEADSEYGLTGITEAIAKASSEWGADLLVTGTANRRGLERFVIGSVAERLITKVGASILLVHPHST